MNDQRTTPLTRENFDVDDRGIMNSPQLAAYRDRIERDLRGNILPWWSQHMVDQSRGTFLAEITGEGAPNPAPARGVLLTTRILWSYAAAFRVYGDEELLAMADLAYADLMNRFLDADHGGFIWSIGAADMPVASRKQIYGQAFAIYALAEYHRASVRSEPMHLARTVFDLIEEHGRDREHGGYWEAFGRDWSPIEDVRLSEIDRNDPKSQNTLLHVMEAYTNLLRVWPDDRVRSALRDLVTVMIDHVVDPKTHHLGLFFEPDWKVTTDRCSFGHDIEASWLLWDAGMAVQDEALNRRLLPVVLKIAEVTLETAIDDDGALLYEGGPEGISDYTKEWWPQAEALVGFLNAAQLSGEDRYLEAALGLWDFIESKIIDHTNGEWFRAVDRQGKVISTHEKAGFWKCPYHNTRAALEAIARLNALGAMTTASSIQGDH